MARDERTEATNREAPPRGDGARGRFTRPEVAGARTAGGWGGGGAGWAWALAAVIVAALVAWWVAALASDSEGPEAGVSLREVADEPDEFFGERVTVSGEVADLAPAGLAAGGGQTAQGPIAFALGGDAIGEQVLVVDVNGQGFRFVTEDSVVQVTGTVRQFDAGAFNEDFGIDVFGDGWFDAFDGRPVIVASAVDPTVPEEDGGGDG